MRKLITVALAILVGATFNTTDASAKAKKKKKKEKDNIVVKLDNKADSLSYAAGMVRTEGLYEFLTKQMKIDTVNIAEFIRGYNDYMADSDKKKAAYAVGQQIAMNVKDNMLPFLKKEFKTSNDSINDQLFSKGFTDAIRKDTTLMTEKTAVTYFNSRFREMMEQKKEANKKAGEEFLAANLKKEGVKMTASGLQYKVLREGNGKIATINDDVTVKYEGRLIDGTVFDSSYERSEKTATFKPNQVIKGWTEALTMMPEGSKWELYIPQNLAYGERKAGKIEPYSALIFIVEVDSVKEAKKQ